MNRNRTLIIGILLTATAGFIALQNGFTSNPENETQTPSVTFTDAPTVTPTYEPCGYMWAYHDDIKLKEKIDASVKSLDPNSKAKVSLYGEDCVFSDGHSTFSVMETDIYVYQPVDNLTFEEALGNWISQVMQVIVQIPRDDIQGNYGFVEFWFEKSEVEHVIVRVPIQKYINEAQGKSGAELFQLFSNSP